MCRSIEEMLNQVSAEADNKARARITLLLWDQGMNDIPRIAGITEFTTDQVKNILGSRYAEVV